MAGDSSHSQLPFEQRKVSVAGDAPVVLKGKEIDLQQKSFETVQMASDLLSGKAAVKVDQNTRLLAGGACGVCVCEVAY